MKVLLKQKRVHPVGFRLGRHLVVPGPAKEFELDEKEQKELELKQQTIKDELIKAGLQDIKGISDKNAQTEYMFKFMQAMAPDVVKGSYKNMSKMFMDIFKQQNSKKNKKKT